MIDWETPALAQDQHSEKIAFFAGSRAALMAIETAVLAAEKSVCMGIRNLDPDTPCMTDAAAEAGLAVWSDLLRAVAKRGVTIRVLLADFDPIFTTEEHQAAWRTYRILRSFDDALPEPIQIVCSNHPGACNALGSLIGLPATLSRAREVEASLQDALDGDKSDGQRSGQSVEGNAISNAPGLWPYLRGNERRGTPSLSGLWRHRVVPASHHEKLLIVDDRQVFIGGVDIEKKRLGIEEFRWRDVHARLEGPVVEQARAHFEERWRIERPEFDARFAALVPPKGAKALPSPANPPGSKNDGSSSETTVVKDAPRLVRTSSRRRSGLFVTTPQTVASEIQDAYLEAVGQATTFIYLETQFLRSTALGDALAKRGKDRPDLHLAIVLPHLPERALNETDVNRATRHGIYLQNRILDQLSAVFADRLAVFSVVEFDSDPAADTDDDEWRIADKPIAYVHSKLLIVDGNAAILGSANANGRSFLYDTEAAVRIVDRAAIGRLWTTAAGSLTSNTVASIDASGDQMLASLRAAARRNLARPAEDTDGMSDRAGLVPFDRADSDRLARKSILVPDDLV